MRDPACFSTVFMRQGACLACETCVPVRIVTCMTNPTLAATVVARRADLGLTQAELALKAGIAHRTVQNVEAGRVPMPVKLAAIARALELDAADLWRIAGLGTPARAAS